MWAGPGQANDLYRKLLERFKEMFVVDSLVAEKAMAPHSSTLAWKIPWMEAAVHGVATSPIRLSDFTHFSLSCIGKGNGNPLQVLLPGESQGWESLVGCRLWGCRVGHD